MEDFFCLSHSDWEHNSKRHNRPKIKKVTCDNRGEIDAYICYQRQKRERGSDTIYAENVRMWTSSLVGAKKCKEGGGGLKTKQTEPMGVYTVHICTSKVLTF